MIVANYIAYILLLIGGLNWGLVGLFNFNLVAWICMGSRVAERIIYILVLLSTIWLIISPIIDGGIILSSRLGRINQNPTTNPTV
ncbi:MAG: DUF378 domain-containing protein [Clostridia bacterium]|nr:DUF378 domain-containing protein [Clostridia bacterium]